jgi:hypothetical protein
MCYAGFRYISIFVNKYLNHSTKEFIVKIMLPKARLWELSQLSSCVWLTLAEEDCSVWCGVIKLTRCGDYQLLGHSAGQHNTQNHNNQCTQATNIHSTWQQHNHLVVMVLCAQLDNITHEFTTTSAHRPSTFTVHDNNITISAFK